MRDALRASLSTDPGFEGYPKGAVIVCGDCWRPIYKLERGVAPGDKCGRAASAFAPMRQADFRDLDTRVDLDAGWRGLLAVYALSPESQAVTGARRPRAGDEAVCPACGGQFLKVRTVTKSETLDHAYVWEMLWVPPLAARCANRFVGERTRWRVDVPDEAEIS